MVQKRAQEEAKLNERFEANGTGDGVECHTDEENGENTESKPPEKQDERRQVDHKDELRLFNIVFTVPASTSSQRANR